LQVGHEARGGGVLGVRDRGARRRERRVHAERRLRGDGVREPERACELAAGLDDLLHEPDAQPHSRGNRSVAPPTGQEIDGRRPPRLISIWPNRAEVAATRTSVASSSSMPIVKHVP
jgi:hypothetical protein